jgi:PAS domain S-box-containing protein
VRDGRLYAKALEISLVASIFSFHISENSIGKANLLTVQASNTTALNRGVKDFLAFSPHPALVVSLLTGITYFFAARIGFALTVGAHPVSLMWPANTILLAALLLSPPRHWGMILLAVLPAHLAAEWESSVPLTMVLSWFASNCSEALIGAVATRFLTGKQLAFDRFRCVCVFLLCGVLLAPLLSSFLDAALVELNHWGKDGYWEVWRMRFFSNMFAAATIGMTVLTWFGSGPKPRLSPARLAEAGLLVLGLVAVVSFVVVHSLGARAELTGGLWLYAPWPFLLWAALRFGTRGASTAILIVSAWTVWSVVRAHPQFLAAEQQSVRAIQVFFVVQALMLMPLASVLNERERVAHDLRVSEERYRGVVETQPDLICRFLPDTTLTFANLSYARSFQLSTRDLIGRKFLDFVPARAHEYLMLKIATVVSERRTVVGEHEVLLPGGEVGWHQWINHPIVSEDGHISEIQAIGRDVTERRRTEAALREITERNRAMLMAIPDSIFLADKSGVLLDCHTRDESLLLVPTPFCLGQHVRDVLPEKLATELVKCFESVLRTGETAVVQSPLAISGGQRSYEARLVQCGPDRLLGLVRDVTEQNRAEEALKESEERYREVVETQTEMVSRCRPDTTLTFANEAYCRFFALPRKDLVGRTLLEFFPPAVHVKIIRSIAEVNNGGGTAVWEHLFTSPGGKARWVQWKNYAICNSKGRVEEIQGIGKDITDRKRAEEARQKLIHASRLAVVGEFTSMVAHEVNQPLSAILTNTDAARALLSRAPFPLEDIRAILADIHEDILRVDETIRGLRALSQRREMEMQPLDLNRLVEDVVQLASGDASRRRVQVQMELAPDLPMGQGDPIHIQHVLLNLISNGMDALDDVPISQRLLLITTESRGGRELVVGVKDTGYGIPPDKLPRVFESFYSTKERGMGLGLSIALTIVKAHHGIIWVEKNPDRGVTFYFTVPVQNTRDSGPMAS